MNTRTILGALCLLAAAAAGNAASEPLLLRNVRLVDPDLAVTTGPTSILVADGRVQAVGDIRAPRRAATIDCRGGFALPGLFDSHTHLAHLTLTGDDSLAQALRGFVARGVLQVRDVGGPLDVLQRLRGRIDSGDLLGPDVFYAGPMLEKGPLTWEQMNARLPGFTVAVDDSAAVDSLVPALAAGGASLIKTFGKFDRGVYAHLAARAAARGLPIAHDPGLPLFQEIPLDVAVAAGAGSLEHGTAPWPAALADSLAFEHDSLLASHAPPLARMLFMSRVFALGPASISDAKLARLIDRMTERGVYLCPTLQVFRVILAQGGPEDEPPAQQMMRERSLSALDRVSRRLTERMARGGVRMLVGQDGCRPAGALAEVRELQSIGLSRAEILRGLTVYPARFLDVADRYGAIAPGKVANLVVLPGNPLEDLAHLASPVLVVKSGEVVARAE